ncbi:ABC transporter ATP-binding protein [Paenibacillus sp. LHD-38]|uniref:ABC transporter ATP-binding protein n=1 Tax=Paenibacillus sp. LHD-38 TaxID=3072143 RepID=UPI00280F5E67|nr:ABC transporter ATP-binding protein [Paenibacillus sp. LHD-38]MDQ8734511.1 ABC transporter ATP-binding protein [Paenibacillus sp. LHD-38]
MSPIKRYILWAKPYWWMICIIIAVGILQFTAPLSTPVFTQLLVDDVLIGDDYSRLTNTVLLMAFILFFGVLLNFLRNYISAILGNKMMMHLREQLYDHLQRMSVSYYDQRQVGGVASRVIHDVGGAQNLIGGGIINLVLDLCMVLFAGFLLFRMNVTLALISLCVLPFYYLSFTNMNVWIRLAWRSVHRQMERVSGTLVERMGGIRIVQAFNGEKQEKIRFNKQTEQHFHHTVTAHLFSNILGRLSESLSHVGGIVIWFIGGGLVLKGEMSAGEIIAFQMLLGNLYGPIQRFADVNVTIQNSVTNIERIFEVFDEKPDIVERSNAYPMPECKGEVEFRDVTYTYLTLNLIYNDNHNQRANPDLIERERPPKKFYWIPTHLPPKLPEVEIEKRTGIRDITFKAKSGEVIALVGPSGAGKSTLINLIPRFYDPVDGAVFIDGKDARDYKLEELRKHIAIVLQDNVLFSGTIKDNMIYGRENVTMEEIVTASKAANAHEFIADFKDGYETIIGERGMRLSGGQKQRLAIARALLKNPKILILDEATSALDSESEALVTEALERLMKDRTTFIIAHRLATVVRADQILVVDGGEIVQRGSHRQLLAEGGLYRKLYELQLKAMRPEEIHSGA